MALRIARVVVFSLIASWSLACAIVPTEPTEPAGTSEPAALAEIPGGEDSPKLSDEGLEKMNFPGAGIVFMRPGRPIGAYDSFLLSEVELSFKRSRHSERDEWRIRDHVEDRVRNDMLATGLPIVDSPTPCTVIVEIGILDIDLTDPVESTGSNTSFVKSWGQATMVQNLYDGETGEPLMRFAMRRSIPGGVFYGARGQRDWSRIEATLDDLMRDTQVALLAGLPLADTPPTKQGCNSGIYKLRASTG